MGNRPKLPPIARAGDGTPEGKAIAEMKEILGSGGTFTPMTEEEILRIQQGTRNHLIHINGVPFQNYKVLERRGKLVWRAPGKAGADLDRLPLAVYIARQQQNYNSALNKVYRTTDLIIRNRARNGKGCKDGVLRLAKEYAEKGCKKTSKLIAKKLGVTQRSVQRILKEEKIKSDTPKSPDFNP